MALTWTSALAWLPALGRGALPFHRTPKQAGASGRSGDGGLLAASLLFVFVGLVDAARGEAAATLACGLLALVWPCSRMVDANLRAATARGPEPACARCAA